MNQAEKLSLAALFFVQSFPRGILLSVVPLKALALMGDAQRASILLFLVSAGGILSALMTPAIIRRVGRYRAFLLGSVTMILSVLLMISSDPVMFALGLFLHVFAIACMEVALTLYVLARIPRNRYTAFEPWRVLCSIAALSIGPFLGVYLQHAWSPAAPFLLAVIFMLLAIVYLRALGLHRLPSPPDRSTTANPLRHLGRFFRQPRLALAYGLSLARSCWWTMFVIYTPIYAQQTGLGELAGAALVSIGTAWTLSVPFWGWVGRQFGVRCLFTLGFTTTALFSAVAFFLADMPSLAAAVLIAAALGATMLDGQGNVLFYRSVHARERADMTAVFVTYRDTGQLATPGVFAVLLGVFPLSIVFAGAAVWMTVAAGFCRFIPRRLR